MFVRYFLMLICLASLGMCQTASAESNSSTWWAWAYNADTLTLFNNDGIYSTMPRPHLENEATDASPTLYFSPDGSRLIISALLENNHIGVGFYDVTRQKWMSQHETQTTESFSGQVLFNEATGQVSLGFITPDSSTWRIIIFDVTTGNVQRELSSQSELFEVYPELETGSYTPQLVYFEEQTLHFQLLADQVSQSAPVLSLAWQIEANELDSSPYEHPKSTISPKNHFVVFPDEEHIIINDGQKDVTLDTSIPYTSVQWVDGERQLLLGSSETWALYNLDAQTSVDLASPDSPLISAYSTSEGIVGINQDGVVIFYPYSDPEQSILLSEEISGQLIWVQPEGIAFNGANPALAVVNTPQLNVRVQPGKGSNILTTIPEGTQVTILERLEDNSWVKIQTPDESTGWVLTMLLATTVEFNTIPVNRTVAFVDATPEATSEPTVIAEQPSPTPAPPNEPTSEPTAMPTIPPNPDGSYQVRYQQFEHGFMLEVVAGQSSFQNPSIPCVFAYNTEQTDIIIPLYFINLYHNSYHYCLEYAGLDVNLETPPDGFSQPEGPFGLLWGNYSEIRDSLGYATAAAFTYNGVIPPADPYTGEISFVLPVITLPDNTSLYCGSRAATAGTCYIRG
jgi:uncharacterized protein YgiM (DUF1202 family)